MGTTRPESINVNHRINNWLRTTTHKDNQGYFLASYEIAHHPFPRGSLAYWGLIKIAYPQEAESKAFVLQTDVDKYEP